MYYKLLILILVLSISFTQFNCAPSMRSAKIQPEFSVDGAFLTTIFSANSTDEQGNDVTDTSVDSDLPIPFDIKFRYGWERKEDFGFELSGGLDGQLGAYLELPGTNEFHWGFGVETNIWLMALSRSNDEDEDVAEFISDNNYHLYLIGGYFPNSKFEISAGIKYQPFLNSFLEGISETEIDAGGTMPLTYLLDTRYMISEHFGLMGGAEIFDLSFSGQGQEKASLTGGYVYIGLTYR